MTMPLTERQKNDYQWAVHSPSLRTADGTDLWPADDWYRNQPTPTPTALLEKPDKRLGIRFESLIQRWISESADLELVEANLPVRDGQRTLGEFDMIVKEKDQINHWEVAVKFYLSVNGELGLDRWYGPNPTDTLGQKLSRLITHQLRLSEQPAATQLLAEKGVAVSGHRAIVKGRLFYPIDDYVANSFNYPAEINPGHLKGWWSRLDDLSESSLIEKDARFVLLNKDYWLAPVSVNDDLESLGVGLLISELKKQQDLETRHVAIVDQAGNETSRGFIVTDRWLDRLPRS